MDEISKLFHLDNSSDLQQHKKALYNNLKQGSKEPRLVTRQQKIGVINFVQPGLKSCTFPADPKKHKGVGTFFFFKQKMVQEVTAKESTAWLMLGTAGCINQT